MALPNLRGFWANQIYTSTWYDQSCRAAPNNLTLTGAVDPIDIGIATEWPGVLAPYLALDGTNDYASIADNADLSITTDITMGTWVYVSKLNVEQGIINKSLTTGNVRGYRLYLSSDNKFTFEISTDGTAIKSVQSAAETTVNAWRFVCCRFDASTELSIRVDNGAWIDNTTSIPASIYDNARAFRIGESDENSARRLAGRIAQVWICAYYLGDDVVDWLYRVQVPLFGEALPGGVYVGPTTTTIYSTKDTGISSADPTTNFGTDASVELGYNAARNVLVYFDMSGIPAGSTVNTATLSIYVDAKYGLWNSITVGVFRVIRSWNETQATWNKSDNSTNWGTAGCNNTTTDRDGTAEGSITIYNVSGVWKTLDITALVQEWVNGTANQGIALIQTNTATNTAYGITMREGANDPKLEVTYTAA
jgi:hypothetical protein